MTLCQAPLCSSRNFQFKIWQCTESIRFLCIFGPPLFPPYPICRGQIVLLKHCLSLVSAPQSAQSGECLAWSVVKIDACHNKMYTPLQVFEYCTTDLKKFMDRTGKGPTNPLPASLVKVVASPCCFWLNIVVSPTHHTSPWEWVSTLSQCHS